MGADKKGPFWSFREVREAADGRWVDILESLTPEIAEALASSGRMTQHRPCPVHGGKDGFRLFRDVAHTGGGICNSCGAFHDGFSLIGWLRGWSFRETVEEVARALGLSPDPSSRPRLTRVAPPPPLRETPPARRAQDMRDLWSASVCLDHPEAAPASRYLAARGLDGDRLIPLISPVSLRFHPAVPYYEEGQPTRVFPALLAAARGPRGQAVTLHRTYLAPDGSGKAPVVKSKKLMSAVGSGAAVRLGLPFQGHIGVAEGLETALAVLQRQGYGCWSCISGAVLAMFEPPEGITHVTIWADKDRALNARDRLPVGEHYARQLAARLRARGLTVTIALPPHPIPPGAKSVDWADVLMTQKRAVAPPAKACQHVPLSQ